jgi:hypothetical protein
MAKIFPNLMHPKDSVLGLNSPLFNHFLNRVNSNICSAGFILVIFYLV